ncbi:hypothetical protein G6F57_002792 [Rhizopus arrhizus]|nr:hypothetical protein G6F23_004753 [Rhizopus arrhizus]KAG1054188.1 hypothetical protein G6F43_003774 [Rhizopus delemar]KAG0762204.1 hypothetical protein G6F24_006973 [Rhizopus arrhizus]KAG0784520.1 hypothetical protein G6F22_008284 [Rhizopus arrhizus]KAG0790823.1 hypothetical protein G6F21_005524 [Rhizopus arrhizus]
MERRIIREESSNDKWGILVKIHLGEIKAQPIRFDTFTKKAYFSIFMDPVNIKTMFDHNRLIHCALTKKDDESYATNNKFVITVEKGMTEGRTIQVDVQNELCQVQAELTRLPTPPPSPQLDEKENYFKQPLDLVTPLAPAPLTYTLQITELCLPLSTIAA